MHRGGNQNFNLFQGKWLPIFKDAASPHTTQYKTIKFPEVCIWIRYIDAYFRINVFFYGDFRINVGGWESRRFFMAKAQRIRYRRTV
jgi:hypothetical protein